MGEFGKPARTILVIDDSRTNLNVIGERLTALGYFTALADNGGEALDLIAARGFDLVLLDMVMPGMSGLQVLAELRSRTETSDLPVIVVTAQSDPAAAVAALTAGADDYLAKPFDFDVLAARIERTLARARRVADLKRSNAALDARIAARAMELGETRAELADVRAERQRLIAEVERLRA
ncbi:response regulator [Sphingomonas sp.]|jgi:DNA-binding response OmpR family regulator|uniref:response regulator n=1 Tax=Sphingomonas sp. TaxID=28214 RepID=UPI002E2FF5AF|nr:response regulator [Sphingomonas sp.]HEX4694609.1 response regulator [Sphingomonas sp.]